MNFDGIGSISGGRGGRGPHLGTKFFLILLTSFVALVAPSHDEKPKGSLGFV